MTQELRDDAGVRYQVVDEGDPNDPLRVPGAQASQPLKGSEPANAEPEGDQADPDTTDVDGTASDPDPEDEGDLSEEELSALEGRLDEYIASEVDKRIGTRVGSVQQAKDREIANLNQRIKAQDEQMKAIRQEIREGKLAALTPEEQSKMREQWDFEDRKTSLDTYETELDGFYRDLMIQALVIDYKEFGVTAEELSEIDDPDEMEQACKDKELAYWRGVASGEIKPKQGVQSGVTKQAPTRETRATPAGKQAPAGASAPSDLGTSGSPDSGAAKGKVAEGTGLKSLAETYANLPFESVRLA